MGSWSTCKFCGEAIVWARMPAGNYLPMDPYGGFHECVLFSTEESSSSPELPVPSWDIFKDKKNLTFNTTCWWCGADVFFYRDENGGCVLFDELGAPWQVHSCWEEHRLERTACQNHLNSALKDLEYNGDYYYGADCVVRRQPINDEFEVNMFGYVLDNRSLYDEPEQIKYVAAEHASSVPFSELWISHTKSLALPFLAPYDLARKIPDYAMVKVKGSWARYKEDWILILRTVDVLLIDGYCSATHKYSNNSFPLECRYCGVEIRDGDEWGFDVEGAVECISCSSIRGDSNPDEFVSFCSKIAENIARKT